MTFLRPTVIQQSKLLQKGHREALVFDSSEPSSRFCVVTKSMDEAIEISDQIAPEHLEIMTADAMQASFFQLVTVAVTFSVLQVGMKCNNYGGLFIGRYAAEVEISKILHVS